MKTDELVLLALRDALTDRGIPVGPTSGAFVALGDVPLDLHLHDVTLHEEPRKPTAVSVIFDARSRSAQDPGVCVLSMGYGDTLAASARDAADQWLAGVFPVVQSWLTQRAHVCTVTKAQMIVAVQETAEQFGWSVHLGPILHRLYAAPPHTYSPPDVSPDIVFKPVFNAVHPLAAHKTLFWLECFAARYPDGTVDATARFHNEDWPEGKEALLAWAAEWPDTDGCLLSRRQFLMFEPVPVHLLSSSGSMKEALAHQAAEPRPWWKRIFGGV